MDSPTVDTYSVILEHLIATLHDFHFWRTTNIAARLTRDCQLNESEPDQVPERRHVCSNPAIGFLWILVPFLNKPGRIWSAVCGVGGARAPEFNESAIKIVQRASDRLIAVKS